MAIVPMKRLELYGLLKHKAIFLQELQRMGLVELVDLAEADEKARTAQAQQLIPIENEIGQISRVLTIFDRFAPEKPNIIEQFAGMKTVLTWEERQNYLAQEDRVAALKKEIFKAEIEYNQLEQEINQIDRELSELKPWVALDLSAEKWQGSQRIRIMLGIMEGSAKALAPMDSQQNLSMAVQEIHQENDRIFMVLFVPRIFDHQNLLKQAGISEVKLNGIERGTVKEKVENLQMLREQCAQQMSVLREQLITWSEQRSLFQTFFDRWYNAKLRAESDRLSLNGKAVFAMEGWVKADQVERLVKVFDGLRLPYNISFREPADDENPPVALKNAPVIEPFEALVQSFSYPQSSEVDPTPSVAPFFFLFFGIALGDVGYGLLLAAICGLLIWKLAMKPAGRKMARMFMLSGFGAVFVGALLSSYFGYAPYKGLFTPMDNPTLLLGIVLGLGLLQLYVGTIISAYMTIRSGRWQDALWNQGFWLLFLTGVVLVGIKSSIGLEPYATLINYGTLAAAALVVLANTRGKKGWVAKLIAVPGGFFTIYGSIGFFSDVLSYSRLMALGLSGGVMASIVNMFVGMTWNIPWVGWLIAISIFVVGHLFNFALGILGAYVHSSRLQYLEFFSKFFEGGGEVFSPLKWENKYIYLSKEKEA